ncbi:MAG: hypothetical protein WC735_03565 [Candidatus Paceibacterota bacterium]
MKLFLGILFIKQSISASLRSELLGSSACARLSKKYACNEFHN